LKTVIEEQQTQVTGQAVAREPKKRELAVPSVHVQQAPKPETMSAQPKVDCYESCLDLSALFLPRG
jgi:hypothetical protein